ncbi:MAG TPA: cob(I)yrinic acid a,c-diamide adenosyltransferase [Chloroflexi bacterium]|nr:cob(I)yrinic acid a,c-diamide adenosyltransferase [Chloroflexota bacterium]
MSKKPVFYTRAGDDGSTSIYGQKERISKFHPRPEAYGTIDEAQAVLAVLRAGNCQPRSKELVIRVERDLYLMMGQLAVADNAQLPARVIDQSDVEWLEKAAAEIGEAAGGFSGFVLPGDTLSGAQAHLARTVIRRAERAVARLQHQGDLKNTYILKYLNRLSSLLFVLALFEDKMGGVEKPTYAKDVV